MLELLKNITEALDREKIPYMVSGSVAMMRYAVSRTTRDIDVVIDLQLADIQRFTKIFEHGFYIHEGAIREAIWQTGMFNVIDDKSGFKIDFIVKKNSEYRQIEYNRRKRVLFFDFEIWIVSVEDLIISKLIWIQDFQSDKQMEDIENLLFNNEIDKNYLMEWVNKLKIKTFGLIK